MAQLPLSWLAFAAQALDAVPIQSLVQSFRPTSLWWSSALRRGSGDWASPSIQSWSSPVGRQSDSSHREDGEHGAIHRRDRPSGAHPREEGDDRHHGGEHLCQSPLLARSAFCGGSSWKG